MVTGKIHSIETLGTLDGPGIRTVIFFQGCPLKCLFCHNIDCAIIDGKANEYTANELAEKVLANKHYWGVDEKPNGGITLSGGDAVLQADFLLEFLPIMKKSNVHVAIDTSLFTSPEIIRTLTPFVDLWMVSIKHMDDAVHKQITGVTNQVIHENLKLLDSLLNAPQIRIRYLLVPELTDQVANIEATAVLAKNLRNLESIDILQYTDIGKHKWIELFGKYALEGFRNATQSDVMKAANAFMKYLPEEKIIYSRQ